MNRLLTLIVCAHFANTAISATLNVRSENNPDIQTALQNAQDGDVIIVEQGTYKENIDFLGKAVTLCSANPNDPNVIENTIIDANSPDDPNFESAVLFRNGETNQSVIEGFTIKSGTGRPDPCGASWHWKGTNGGGVFCRQSSPTIRKNLFVNCRVEYGGGAVYCHNRASPIISENTFINNHAGAYGGAVFARLKCSPVISNNVFKSNSCRVLGGAVYLADQCYSKVTGNRFENNCATELSGGAIYYFVDSHPTIANNLFISNSSMITGGGIMVSASSTGSIINNLFIKNEVHNIASYGAVIGVYSNPVIANNIIASNNAVGIYTEPGTNPVLHSNNVWDNEPNNYTGYIQDPTGTNGNISENPRTGVDLPEPLDDYELHPDSPCIDTANKSFIPAWLTSDYDGTDRIVNSALDIGPQESYAIFVPQDYNDIQDAITASNTGGKIIVSPGFYKENLNFEGKNLTLRSVNPLDPCCVAATIIDGNNTSSCIALDSGEDKNSVIAGLNLQNGYAEFGGAIYIDDDAGCTILCNYIHDNNAYRYGGAIDTRHYSNTSICYNRLINNFAEYAGGAIHTGAHARCDIKQNYISENETGTNHHGGGIYCYNHGTVEIIENEICYNTAGYGAGIYAWRACGLIARNHVWANHATVDGGGIGIKPYWQQPYTLLRVRNNLVEANKSDESGGGIGLFRGIHEVHNNTIVNNESWPRGGSGITMLWKAEGNIANNIIAYNKGGPAIYVGPFEPNGNPQFYSNLLWQNEAGNYGGIIPDLNDVNDNINADPCFVSLGYIADNNTPETEDDYWVRGDYRIGYFSHARDNADPNYACQITVDIDNQTRPHFQEFDRGCYELQIYDLTATGTVDVSELKLFADLWLQHGQSLIVDLDDNGFVDYRDYAVIFNDWQR